MKHSQFIACRRRNLRRWIGLGFALPALLWSLGCEPKQVVVNPPSNRTGTGSNGAAQPGRPFGKTLPPGASGQNARAETSSGNDHLALGNPSNAANDPNNYLIERLQYAMAYNDSAGHPNWVSWKLSAGDMGEADRGKFAPDESLPDHFERITPRDYTGSGYDRGHLCPSADRTRSEDDNEATMMMSNIIPQAPGNNQGPWKDLEEACRDIAREGNQLYIVCGGSGESKKKIGRGKVSVPLFTWKVVVILPAGKFAPQDITPDTRVIAVKIPNKSSVREKSWESFRTSIAEIERATGYQFLTTVSPEIQNQLKNKIE